MTLPDKRSPGSHCGWFTSYLWSLIYILPNGLIKQVLFLPRYTWLGKVRTLLPKPKHYSCFISSILTAVRFSSPVMEQGVRKQWEAATRVGQWKGRRVSCLESRRKCCNVKILNFVNEYQKTHIFTQSMLNISVSQSERGKLWLIELSLDAKGRSFYPLFVIDMSLFCSVLF